MLWLSLAYTHSLVLKSQGSRGFPSGFLKRPLEGQGLDPLCNQMHYTDSEGVHATADVFLFAKLFFFSSIMTTPGMPLLVMPASPIIPSLLHFLSCTEASLP